MKKGLLVLCILVGAGIYAQTSEVATPTSLRVSHRYDIRTKENGRYLGLFYGGAMGVWTWNQSGTVTARYLMEEQGLRDTRYLEKKLSSELTTRFPHLTDGRIGKVEGDGGPVFRNFPFRPTGLEWKPGQTWISSGEVAWDWDGSGKILPVPILTEYKVLGKKTDSQGEYWEVTALHALRFRGTPGLDTEISSIQGRHETLLQWGENQNYPRFFRIKIDEEIKTRQKTLSRSGFWLNWYAGVVPLGKPELAQELNQSFQDAEITDVQVQSGEEGVKLTLQNLQFVADQATLLPGEEGRLDTIADVLKAIPGRSLVITGHTADVGRPAEQAKLSEDRARAIVEALKSRGIEAARMYYRGKGATEPLGDNQTPEGRGVNRRVEITILED